MNNVVINGYVQKNTEYTLDENKVPEFRFFVSVDTPTLFGVSIIPVKTKGELAARCYAELKEGGYIEIQGEICKPDNMLVYVFAHQIMYQPKESDSQIVWRSNEFFTLYKPDAVLAEMAKFEKKQERKKRKNTK